MKYTWEDQDVKVGLVVLSKRVNGEPIKWILSYWDKANHGLDNGWFAISEFGVVQFLRGVPEVATWLNVFGMRPS
jgi:hypothetical protein